MRGISRRPIRIVLGSAAVALVVLAGCSSSDSGSTASSTTASTAAGSTDSTGSTGSTPGTTDADSPGTTAGTTDEIDNDDILAALEADAPELAALVDYDYMSWNAFGGFTIPVPEGTDTATAIELCEAVSEVVYQGPDYSIVIATGVTMDNLLGTPIVERASEAETCAAV
jgi:hypothetical protein